MTMTDPIADFLTRLRNANSAYHDEVSLPHSKIKANIAEILKTEGYISDFRTEDARVGKSLVVKLKYGPNRERSLAGLRRVSKPGLRVYAKSTNLPRVLGGAGQAEGHAQRQRGTGHAAGRCSRAAALAARWGSGAQVHAGPSVRAAAAKRWRGFRVDRI